MPVNGTLNDKATLRQLLNHSQEFDPSAFLRADQSKQR
jgi:hypothetical protein